MPISQNNNSKLRTMSTPQKTHDEGLVAGLSSTRDHQIEIVLAVLKETLEKLKISLIFPKIFENPKTLYKYLKGTRFEECHKLVMKYRDQKKHQAFEPPTKIDYELVNNIDYIHENYKLIELLPNWLDDINSDETIALESFSSLLEIAQDRFRQTALSELTKEKYLHEVYEANEQVKADIEEILVKIEQHRFNKKWKSVAKSAVIKDIEDELADRQHGNRVNVSAEIARCNHEMHKLDNYSSIQQKELDEEYENVRFKYESTLKIDLQQEKIIRDEKNKYQSQLELLIKKYDQIMRDKNNEESRYIEEYNKMKHEYDEFMIEYNSEYSNYDEIVRQQERKWEAKIREFFHSLAARRIQRWWRCILRENKKKERSTSKAIKEKGKGRSTGREVKSSKEKPLEDVKTKGKKIKKAKKKK